MTSKTLLVAQREYLENVRTKTFWIGILAFPILITISFGATFVLNKLKQTQRYAVLDTSAEKIGDRIERAARSTDLMAFAKLLQKADAALPDSVRREGDQIGAIPMGTGNEPTKPDDATLERVQRAMQNVPVSDLEAVIEKNAGFDTAKKYVRASLADLGLDGKPLDEQRRALSAMVNDGRLFAYLEIGRDPLRSLEDFAYVSNNKTDSALRDWYEDAATTVVRQLRIKDSQIAPEVAKRIQEEVSFRQQKIGESGAAEDVTVADKAGGWAPVAFVYLLWIAIFTAAQMLLTNTVEEKSNRIIEVLLSSVSPRELMAGKIWGIAATGLTLTGTWAACAGIAVWLAPKLLVGRDLSWTAVIGNPLFLASFVGYFLAGYLLYAAILVSLGSVCNSLKEAQNLLQPVFVLLIVPLVSMMFIAQEPNGLVAKVLSFVPLFTPFTMMNRAGGPPEVWEYIATSVLLLACVWLAFRGAGKIFRIGVLMTGNPPKMKEILGWLRE